MSSSSSSSVGFVVLVMLATHGLHTSAAPLTAAPSYWSTTAACVGLASPDELVRHSLVVMTPALRVEPALHAPTETLMNFFFSELAHDFALKYCPRVSLETREPHPAAPTLAGENTLPLEHFDCDILVGDVPYGVSRAYAESKQPLHALVMANPVETTLADFRRAAHDPSHPNHAHLSTISLHTAILQTAALAPAEQAQAGLLLNPVTWRLCGPGCHPETMTLESALEQATANLNTNMLLVLTEQSPMWSDLVRLATSHNTQDNTNTNTNTNTQINASPSLSLGSMHRRALSAPARSAAAATAELTPAEISILETANHADRVLYNLVQAREADQRKCLRGARAAAHRRFHL